MRDKSMSFRCKSTFILLLLMVGAAGGALVDLGVSIATGWTGVGSGSVFAGGG
ncbi:MAG: hypothetical protein IPL33_17000 [Sphingobacteriales bacterium]|nr:hypothetical protein [Sphingobacteriales bacterium]